MTAEEYRAHPALNFSLAKHLLTSPAHFKAAQDEEKEETDALRLGTLAHAMVLEGKDLRGLYAIKPEGMSFSTNEGKAWKAKQTLPILKEKDAAGIPFMAESVAANHVAANLLRGCSQVERPIFFTLRGVECKALLDMCGCDPYGVWALGDFKTTVDASPRKFANTICDMHYDMQMAWYCDGLSKVEGLEVAPWCFWIASEKKAPWVNAVYHPTEEMLENGRKKIVTALELYKRCTETGQWPLPFQGTTDLELPTWAKHQPQPRAEVAA